MNIRFFKQHKSYQYNMLHMKSLSEQAHFKAPVMQYLLVVKRVEILPQRIYIFNNTIKELFTHTVGKHNLIVKRVE